MSLELLIEQLARPLSLVADICSAEARTLDQLPFITNRNSYYSSLANGSAGLALTCGFLDKAYPDSGWDNVAHVYLQRSLETPQHRMPGLFDGLAGIGLAADYLSRDQSRYKRLLATIETSLEPDVNRLCNAVEQAEEGCHFPMFDLISGLSGIGIFLLRRRGSGFASGMLDRICAALCRLILVAPNNPSWRQPAHLLRESCRVYDLNLGLAHGLPGILVALSKFKAAGLQVPRLDEALATGVGYLIRLCSVDAFGRNWASWQDLHNRSSFDSMESRTAWCYGAPGVCAALWLAGWNSSQPAWRELAREGMAAVEARTLAQGWTEGPTFCHGTAGVLHVARRFAAESGECLLLRDFLLEKLIDQYEPASELGFTDVGPDEVRLDRLGVLQGTAGILLVLLGLHRPEIESDWDEMFALR